IVAMYAGMAITIIRGTGRLSIARAVFQGTICGLLAGAGGFSTTTMLGRSLSLPDSWLFWMAIGAPTVGEFGHFLNRFSLRHRGKPDSGLFAPLGRLHAAAWAPFRRFLYALGIAIFEGNDPNEIPML